MLPQARGLVLEDVTVEPDLLDCRPQKVLVVGGDGLVGQCGRDHVDEIGPQHGRVVAVADGPVGVPWDVVEELVDLARRGLGIGG